MSSSNSRSAGACAERLVARLQNILETGIQSCRLATSKTSSRKRTR